jgi:hypothetical protein
VVVALVCVGAIVPGAQAQGPTWEPLGAPGPIARLFAPASGALLAAGDGKLVRSDDGGATWREIALPPGADLSFAIRTSYKPPRVGPGRLAADPSNHDVLYVSAGGLQKSVDGGVTWTPLEIGEGTVVAVAVSPADSDVVHAVVATQAREWHRLRSHDGGATWEQMAKFADTTPSNRPPLDYAVYIFQPHPTDPDRIFIAAGGTTGRSTQVSLYDGYDGSGPQPTPELKFDPGYFTDAEHLVGGGGAAPSRYYGAFSTRPSPYNQGTTTKLLRADEGGEQIMVFEAKGGGSLSGRPIGDVLEPAVFIDALAYDPKAPDHVYIGLDEYQVVTTGTSYSQSVDLTRTRTHVMGSTDGGASWSEIGQEDLGAEIRDLALGIDGANLYAATEGGVFRLRLR